MTTDVEATPASSAVSLRAGQGDRYGNRKPHFPFLPDFSNKLLKASIGQGDVFVRWVLLAEIDGSSKRQQKLVAPLTETFVIQEMRQ